MGHKLLQNIEGACALCPPQRLQGAAGSQALLLDPRLPVGTLTVSISRLKLSS